VNVLVFRLLWAWKHKRPISKLTLYCFIGLLVIPPVISWLMIPLLPTKQYTHSIVIVQPNIDPYEKISTGSFDAQLSKLIRLSDSAIDDNTALVVWPETALYDEHGFEEDHLKENYFLRPLWAFLQRHPHINLLTGIEGYRLFPNKHSATAMAIPNTSEYLETYNTAALFDSAGPQVLYHKSRFVPGAESLPPYLRFMVPLFEKFGGTEDGYTPQPLRTPIQTTNHSYTIAPSECYEAIYGEYMAEFVHNGADLIAVITNDGWWGDTPGYHQHVSYAGLRAIESRRWTLFCANTGMSAVIDPYGKIVDSRPWWKTAVMKVPVPPTQELTFYVRYGDCISKLALGLALLFWIWHFITIVQRKRSHG
jgi:apolipoprotein N-acyltransferase